MAGGHDFTSTEQVLLRPTVAARQAEKNKDPLPLRERYVGGGGMLTLCRECDEFFDALARDACWKGVAHTSLDFYRRWCDWTLNEKVIEGMAGAWPIC